MHSIGAALVVWSLMSPPHHHGEFTLEHTDPLEVAETVASLLGPEDTATLGVDVRRRTLTVSGSAKMVRLLERVCAQLDGPRATFEVAVRWADGREELLLMTANTPRRLTRQLLTRASPTSLVEPDL